MRRAAILLIAGLFAVSCSRKPAGSGSESGPANPAAFRDFVEEYFHSYFAFYPSTGTSTGFHEYDGKLEDFSAAKFRDRSADLRGQLGRLDALRKTNLSAEDAIDAELIDNKIRAELLDIDTLRSWRKNGIPYITTPGQAVDLIMKRNYAPKLERLRLLISRMQGIEPMLNALHNNVTEPPREFTELTLRICQGSVGFFRKEVAEWAKDAAGADDALYSEFQSINRKVIAALEVTSRFLSTDQLPLSTGSFAIGPENFRKKLLYEEMIDLPLDKLLAIGEAQLEKDRQEFLAVAKKIQPNASPAEVMKTLSNEHPSEDKLLDFAKATLEDIRKFVVDKKIIRIPSDVRPTILETPPYARTGTFASMDTPGAYESVAKEAMYYVTPTEPSWTRAHKEEHLRMFNKPVMDLITIHEAYPGHYTQFLFAKDFPTKTRRILATSSNAEGWAHYAEQMMVEEGFGAADPKVHLAQLSEALLRDCRYISGIRLHTQNQTVEQAARLFIEKGYQEPANGEEEARRGTYDPTYLYYTAGKLQIYKLREDYKRSKGSAYSLGDFHTNFIKQGSIPNKMIRRILLNGDQSPDL